MTLLSKGLNGPLGQFPVHSFCCAPYHYPTTEVFKVQTFPEYRFFRVLCPLLTSHSEFSLRASEKNIRTSVKPPQLRILIGFILHNSHLLCQSEY